MPKDTLGRREREPNKVEAIYMAELVERHGLQRATQALGLSDNAISLNVRDGYTRYAYEKLAEYIINEEDAPKPEARKVVRTLIARVPGEKEMAVTATLEAMGVQYSLLAE